jgi:hypothetical protein
MNNDLAYSRAAFVAKKKKFLIFDSDLSGPHVVKSFFIRPASSLWHSLQELTISG